ncbi:MAG: transketolase [Candidatus Muirbacterium halophilum]|nr:transketolase [Candidatus Muirbacterium halophilum]MCK9475418.1 transketolase [Candidatus Muirbacterium halophilum]
MSVDLKMNAVNTIRGIAVDAINKANSGHPGLPLGAAPMAYTLMAQNMRHYGENSKWLGRDRFVLSAGHGSALLYTLLHVFGYKVSLDDIKDFRQWNSNTPGHPEYRFTDGVETTTGPLGQGFATAVGMEIAREHLSSIFDTKDIKLFDHNTYSLLGDGCMMEGLSSEAASLAGHLKLSNLIVLYDDNNITIEGNTDLAFSEDVEKRFLSYGFEVLRVIDGNNIDEIDNVIKKAKKSDRPSLIMIKTVIGFGSPNMAGTSKVHGSPLGKEEAILTKKALNLPEDKDFYISKEVKEHFETIKANLKEEYNKYNEKFEQYKTKYADKFELLESYLNDSFIEKFDVEQITFDKKSIATREAVGIALNAIALKVPNFIGGSADLSPSTKTDIKGSDSFSAYNRKGRNIHYGIREHAMGSIVNGITLYLDGKFRGYGSTFLVFSDYMRQSIRLSALMEIPSINIFTHDSIGVGEDGPTHQPIEQLMSLRLIPGLYVVRPADAKETAYYTHWAFSGDSPVCMALTRQNLPVLDVVNDNCLRGGYVIKDVKSPQIILLATGSEVSLAISSSEELEKQNINARVVSMPCVELFEEQLEEYKEKVLPKNIPVVVLEAGVSTGWGKFAGKDGAYICIDTFGASARSETIFENYGFSVSNVVKVVKNTIK